MCARPWQRGHLQHAQKSSKVVVGSGTYTPVRAGRAPGKHVKQELFDGAFCDPVQVDTMQ